MSLQKEVKQLHEFVEKAEYSQLLEKEFSQLSKIMTGLSALYKKNSFSFKEDYEKLIGMLLEMPIGQRYNDKIDALYSKIKKIHTMPHQKEMKYHNEIVVEGMGLVSNMIKDIAKQIKDSEIKKENSIHKVTEKIKSAISFIFK